MKYLETKQIPLDEIQESEYKLRTETSEKGLDRLARSIHQHGLIHAVAVRKNPQPGEKPYVLVAGHRRALAHQLLELPTIRVEVWDATDEEAQNPDQFEHHAEAVTLASNVIFQPLSMLELGRRYHRWVAEFGMTPEQVAEALDEDLSVIHEGLLLAQISPEAQEIIEHNPENVSPGALRVMAEEAPRTPVEAQVKLATWLTEQAKDKTAVINSESVHRMARAARKDVRHQKKSSTTPVLRVRTHSDSWLTKKLSDYVTQAEDALRNFKGMHRPNQISFSEVTVLEQRIQALANGWPEAFKELKAAVAGLQEVTSGANGTS